VKYGTKTRQERYSMHCPHRAWLAGARIYTMRAARADFSSFFFLS